MEYCIAMEKTTKQRAMRAEDGAPKEPKIEELSDAEDACPRIDPRNIPWSSVNDFDDIDPCTGKDAMPEDRIIEELPDPMNIPWSSVDDFHQNWNSPTSEYSLPVNKYSFQTGDRTPEYASDVLSDFPHDNTMQLQQQLQLQQQQQQYQQYQQHQQEQENQQQPFSMLSNNNAANDDTSSNENKNSNTTMMFGGCPPGQHPPVSSNDSCFLPDDALTPAYLDPSFFGTHTPEEAYTHTGGGCDPLAYQHDEFHSQHAHEHTDSQHMEHIPSDQMEHMMGENVCAASHYDPHCSNGQEYLYNNPANQVPMCSISSMQSQQQHMVGGINLEMQSQSSTSAFHGSEPTNHHGMMSSQSTNQITNHHLDPMSSQASIDPSYFSLCSASSLNTAPTYGAATLCGMENASNNGSQVNSGDGGNPYSATSTTNNFNNISTNGQFSMCAANSLLSEESFATQQSLCGTLAMGQQQQQGMDMNGISMWAQNMGMGMGGMINSGLGLYEPHTQGANGSEGMTAGGSFYDSASEQLGDDTTTVWHSNNSLGQKLQGEENDTREDNDAHMVGVPSSKFPVSSFPPAPRRWATLDTEQPSEEPENLHLGNQFLTSSDAYQKKFHTSSYASSHSNSNSARNHLSLLPTACRSMGNRNGQSLNATPETVVPHTAWGVDPYEQHHGSGVAGPLASLHPIKKRTPKIPILNSDFRLQSSHAFHMNGRRPFMSTSTRTQIKEPSVPAPPPLSEDVSTGESNKCETTTTATTSTFRSQQQQQQQQKQPQQQQLEEQEEQQQQLEQQEEPPLPKVNRPLYSNSITHIPLTGNGATRRGLRNNSGSSTFRYARWQPDANNEATPENSGETQKNSNAPKKNNKGNQDNIIESRVANQQEKLPLAVVPTTSKYPPPATARSTVQKDEEYAFHIPEGGEKERHLRFPLKENNGRHGHGHAYDVVFGGGSGGGGGHRTKTSGRNSFYNSTPLCYESTSFEGEKSSSAEFGGAAAGGAGGGVAYAKGKGSNSYTSTRYSLNTPVVVHHGSEEDEMDEAEESRRNLFAFAAAHRSKGGFNIRTYPLSPAHKKDGEEEKNVPYGKENKKYENKNRMEGKGGILCKASNEESREDGDCDFMNQFSPVSECGSPPSFTAAFNAPRKFRPLRTRYNQSGGADDSKESFSLEASLVQDEKTSPVGEEGQEGGGPPPASPVDGSMWLERYDPVTNKYVLDLDSGLQLPQRSPKWEPAMHGYYSKDEILETDRVAEEDRTTVMMKNIPNKYTQESVMSLIHSKGFKAAYDFLYLPIDFRSRSNMGYAFINFCTPTDAQDFVKAFTGFSGWLFNSVKVCQIAWSRPYQGLAAHIDRYRNSPTMHSTIPNEFKPAIFFAGQRLPFPTPTRPITSPKRRDVRGGRD